MKLPAMKLIVGLGNPGAEYEGHRHNIGFMAADRMAERHRLGPWRRKFSALICDGSIGGDRVVLLKPQAFMNLSGQSVAEAAKFYKIDPADIVVLHDELDIAPGKLRVKTGGGDAGHNGLRSITQHMGPDYIRVRLGIGHPGSKERVHGWVLGNFAKADREWLDRLLDALADAAPRLASGTFERFQTDVARAMQDAGQRGQRRRQQQNLGLMSKPPAPVQRATKHPAGERGSKSVNAIAENLKKFLAARKKPDDAT